MPKIEDKRWSQSVEQEIYETWVEEGLHRFVYQHGVHKGIVVFDTPPPYASGRIHVGQAAGYIHMDILSRYFRMKGYAVLLPFYSDRNGLPVEVLIEKQYGINPHEVSVTPEGREKFLELCRRHLDSVVEEQIKVLKKLGCLFDYWPNGTDSDEYRKLTQETFIKLYNNGLIYEAERPVNFCVRCKTALAEAEIEYIEEETYLYYIRFDIKGSDKYVVIATTRPELLKACKAVVYHPDDERYRWLEGLYVINPLYGNEIPIMTYREVDVNFGTGLVMLCSYGDQRDVKAFRDLRLEPEVIIDRNGRLTNAAGVLAGLDVASARAKAAEALEEKGYIVRKERIKHNLPVCWRCKTPVQIINSREWFLKQLEFKDKIKEIALNLNFIPDFHRRKLLEWIDSLSMDWPISRDRYYATEIPVWRCTKCGEVNVPKPGRYYKPWKEHAPLERCVKCGASRENLVGERKVFDTWFDSSITVLYVTAYSEKPWIFENAIKIRPQGYEIIRTWLYYSLLRVYQLTGRPAFDYVRVNGMGLDEKGEAMHKSKGNIVDPEPIVDKYGADAVRFWSATASKIGFDYRYSEQLVKTGSFFVTKLLNIARFISSFDRPGEPKKLRLLDELFIALLNEVLVKVDDGYRNLDVYEPANILYDFTWNYFASHYIEMVKGRAYNEKGRYSRVEQEAAWYTLHYILDRVLRALYPIMPYVTTFVYRKMYGKAIYRESFPEPEEGWLKINTKLIDIIKEVNSEIWSYKKKIGLKLKDRLETTVYVPVDLEGVLDEMIDLHNLDNVKLYTEPPFDAKAIGRYVYLSS